MSAALIGSGVGLGLGASYLLAGLADAAGHNRPARIAEAAGDGLPETMLQRGTNPLESASAGTAGVSASGSVAHRVAGRPPRELDCLTDAVYFEARGETPRGQAAVAQVVMNRVANPKFPKTVCAVVFQGAATHGCQFSFACDGSMRRGREAAAWSRARRIAQRALSGVALADIGKATHFHTTGVQPDWGPQMLRVAQVGLHIFYRSNPHAPALQPEDRAVFASLPMGPASNLRLATAVLEKTADATVAASGLAPQPEPSGADVKAASVAKPPEPVSSLTKASEPASPSRSVDSAAS
ncbi:cell wall hydrolase [Phenylobacterium sp.]|uniref:cell wall hydrolase n=1 Tax=Phenylobacterium sp. TaxID=1871053 RepID=UPI002E35C793|nr:cell wall hydrolase [Phenylobacterium sp.]HEX4712825.1 cell wall hydrolase [Phenylobacterium sp.]